MTNRLFARAIRVILVIVAAYALWTVVIPWLRSHGQFDQVSIPTKYDARPSTEGSENGSGSVEDCLSAARSANDRVTERLRGLRDPRTAAQVWESMSQDLHDEVETAQDSCSCSGAACQKATEAMASLDDLIGQFDSTFDGRAESLPDVEAGEREVQQLLAQARRLASGGQN